MLPTGAVMLFPTADSGLTLAGELGTGVLGAAATDDATLEGEDVDGSGLAGGSDGLSSSVAGAFSLASLAAILAWRRFITASSSSAAGSTSWLLAPPPPLPPLLPEDIPLRFGGRCASLLRDHGPPPPSEFPRKNSPVSDTAHLRLPLGGGLFFVPHKCPAEELFCSQRVRPQVKLQDTFLKKIKKIRPGQNGDSSFSVWERRLELRQRQAGEEGNGAGGEE